MVDQGKEKIQQAMDSISPAPDARERMLANIRKKAASAPVSETPSAEKAPASTPIRTVSRRPSFVVIASIAALAAVLIGGSFLLRNALQKKPTPAETSIRTEGGQVLFEKTYDSSEELENATGICLTPPASGIDVLYFSSESDTLAGVRFSIGADMYYLYAVKGNSDAIQAITPDAPSHELDGAQVTVDSETNTETIVWTEDDVTYCLFNSDLATEDDLTEMYREIKK